MELFTKFKPLESKLKILARKLMEEPLYLSDEFRSYEKVWKILISNFIENNPNEFYEIGENFDGIIGFVNIVNNHKVDIVFKLWNKELWGFRFKTQIKQLLKTIVDKYNLKRMATETADIRMTRMAKMCGFKVEGREAFAFQWNKKFYVNYKLRILAKELI